MEGLLIRSPWVDYILSGQKTWELRGSKTNIRGPIALIRSGTGKIVGTCDIVDCVGPLSQSTLLENYQKHLTSKDEIQQNLPYPKTYAWVIRNAKPLTTPIPYKHPSGAVIWVKLDQHLSNEILAQQSIKPRLDIPA